MSGRSREQRVAAGMMLPDLQQLAAAGEGLEKHLGIIPKIQSHDAQQQAADHAMRAVRELGERRPSLFALHTPSIGQLSDIDARLYSHLFQCQMIHRAFEDGINTLQAYNEALVEAGMNHIPRFYRTVPSESRLYNEWQYCVEHATLASYFLDRFVFSRWPRWCQRLRMKLRPNDLDQRSAALLETGTLPAAAPSAAAAPAATA